MITLPVLLNRQSSRVVVQGREPCFGVTSTKKKKESQSHLKKKNNHTSYPNTTTASRVVVQGRQQCFQ